MSEPAMKWALAHRKGYQPNVRRLLLTLADKHVEGRPLYYFSPDFHGILLSMDRIRRWAATMPVPIDHLPGPCVSGFAIMDSCGFVGKDIRSAIRRLEVDDVLNFVEVDFLGQDQFGVLGELYLLTFPLGTQ